MMATPENILGEKSPSGASCALSLTTREEAPQPGTIDLKMEVFDCDDRPDQSLPSDQVESPSSAHFAPSPVRSEQTQPIEPVDLKMEVFDCVETYFGGDDQEADRAELTTDDVVVEKCVDEVSASSDNSSGGVQGSPLIPISTLQSKVEMILPKTEIDDGDFNSKVLVSTVEQGHDKDNSQGSGESQAACTTCHKLFKNTRCVKRHMKICGKPKISLKSSTEKFQCLDCPYETQRKSNLSSHVKARHSPNEIKSRVVCSGCQRSFKHRSSLKNHMRYGCGTELKFECPHCPFKTKRKGSLKTHVGVQHLMKSRQLSINHIKSEPDRESKSNPGLPEVTKTSRKCESGDRPFACSQCSKSYATKFHLSRHMDKFCGKVRLLVCYYCSHKSKLKSDLLRHIFSKHNDILKVRLKRFVCPTCKNSYKHETSLVQHQNYDCGKEPRFQCSQCPYRTKWRNDLDKHTLTHTNIKRVRTDRTNQNSKLQSDSVPTSYEPMCNLNVKSNKERLHSICPESPVDSRGETGLVCGGCQKSFQHESILNNHIRYDCMQEFECPRCPYKTKRKGAWKIHMRTQHPIKNEFIESSSKEETQETTTSTKEIYKCPYCPRQTRWKSGLKAHIHGMHTYSSNRFSCNGCQKDFKYKEGLVRHVKYFCGKEPKFFCARCPFKTNTKCQLQTHYALRHLEDQ